uniref:Beta-fructofuranosidase n=1 Tax=Aureobasidium sp. P6 TaxID=1771980 RepID=A0A1W5LD98_9PEZI|nr:beta-fructofuranosidase [Aureobasidium sp. P6]
MLRNTSLFSTLLCLGSAIAQNVSTTSTSSVPTNTPVPGDYSGALRPQVHFSPPRGFMNDPNGLFVDADGLYHVYYQNPTANVAGNQHWGHATTTDGYTFENQPIALFPPNNETFVFSGSAVVDVNNTSGYFPEQDNGVVAIYTLASSTLQTQNIAFSKDGGYSFEPYEGNPVIDIGSSQFRDPQVFWHSQTQNWVMTVVYASEFAVGIYTSPNLRNWTHASNFSNHGLLGIQYECPNLVEMPVEGSNDTMWLMFISINPGAPLGGSIAQYFPGSFNGTHFEAVDPVARIYDFAKDNYAGQFFSGVPGTEKRLSIDWASNWQYTNDVPTANEGWRSSMTVIRQNHLKQLPGIGWDLVSTPFNISSQFSQELAVNSSLGNSSILLDYSDVPSGAIYFEANVTGLTPDTLAGTLNFTFSSSVSNENVQGGTVPGGATWVSRRNTKWGAENPYFTDKFSASGVYSGSDNGTWTLAGILDRTILELFVNEGEQVATVTFFPEYPLDTLRIGARNLPEGADVSVAVWGLRDAWASQADSNGTVRGNITTSA